MMPPEKAAKIIRRGLMRVRPVIAFPPTFALIARIGGMLPDRRRRWTNAPFRFTVKAYSRPDQEP